MRAPALLAQCLPGLVPHDRGTHSLSSISERDLHLSSPAIEILPSKTAHPYKYAGENVDLQGLNLFKGRVSVVDIIGFNGLDIISSKFDGYLKSWDSSIDLVNVLKHEIRDGQLSFKGKRVLELGSSYGLPGIFACLKGVQVRGKNIKKWKTEEARRFVNKESLKLKRILLVLKQNLKTCRRMNLRKISNFSNFSSQ